MKNPAFFQRLQRFTELAKINIRNRALSQPEIQLEKAFVKIFREQEKVFLTEFARYKSRFSESITPEDLGHIMTRVELETRAGMESELYATCSTAYFTASRHLLATVDLGPDYHLSNPRAVAWLEKNAAAKVTQINEVTRTQMSGIITRGVDEGQSYNSIAKQISQRWGEFAVGKPQLHIQSRAHLVAVTEMAEAYGEGNFQTAQEMESAGLEMEKHWHDVGDERVSEGCISNTSAGWIGIRADFPSGHTHEPRFPGCRCYVAYRRRK